MKTFLDSGVLLTAWKGQDPEKALALLEDPGRDFVSSQFVKLELMPKAKFFKRKLEITFYEKFFARVAKIEPVTQLLAEDAEALAARYGLAAADAINLVAAIRLGAEQFVTTESTDKPMFRVKELQVVSLLQV